MVIEIEGGCVAPLGLALGPGVRERIIEGVADAAGDSDHGALIRARDEGIVAVLRALERGAERDRGGYS